jgi:orotate phosphoribosyltransferase
MEQLTEEALTFAKQSFRFPSVEEALGGDAGLIAERAQLVQDIARNAKKREVAATSGVVLPYVLGMSTTFMDPAVAPRIARVAFAALERVRAAIGASPEERLLLIGMEVAGGIFVSQLAALGGAALAARYDCIYMRKQKKASGAGQQLEGAARITDRTGSTPGAPLRAIWVDDANSTGSSLTAGIEILRADYNIQVAAALYVVDRPADRQSLEPARQFYARPHFVEGRTKVFAMIDLPEIDTAIMQQAASS